ncbi:rhomboid family intramembrane serine protease [Gleimia hominis]|uniref:Rhomboid family intramembrane serine protease n=1 Tax=Gleimia hominis TaxID=595468 RepID=A0ABU3I8V5_9ACTO|nr:rhomboid family intramembrane serine protease [Gleimia hominis]
MSSSSNLSGLRAATVTRTILVVTVVVSTFTLITRLPISTGALGQLANETANYLAYLPIMGWMRPWTLLTVVLVHGGIIHLALNMFTLYVVGPSVEQALGGWRFTALYLLSALGGSVTVLLWGVLEAMVSSRSAALLTWNVGASGALFGLFAAVYILQRHAGMDTRAIVVLLAVNLIYGFMVSNVSWQAHLGGMITGAITTWLLVKVGNKKQYNGPRQLRRAHILTLVGIALVLALIAAGLYWYIGLPQLALG